MRLKRTASILVVSLLALGTLAACTNVQEQPSEKVAEVESGSEITVNEKAYQWEQPMSFSKTTQTNDNMFNPWEQPAIKIEAPVDDEQTNVFETYSYDDNETNVALNFFDDAKFSFAQKSSLYSSDVTLTIGYPAGATVYYTLDGTTPTTDSAVYTAPIVFPAKGGSFPPAQMFRAICVLADGTTSKVAARSYIVGKKLTGRFSTIILAVSGNPAELTEDPDGIFTNAHYEDRGREAEREVYAECWDADGSSIFAQFAGIRVYGGYSRRNLIKSFKLFARSSYDENGKTFKIDSFGTEKLDGSGKIIKKYDKLVVRAFGNDFQFAFIRDELSQALCKEAGFECYEECIPVAVYFNGEYYGCLWMHENYCDKYFKEKYGDAEGEFVIVEGGEMLKNDDSDPVTQHEVNAYNEAYEVLKDLDYTKDENYAKLEAFMDVEDYLDFYAWNYAINNWDWPNNNYKAFRYVEASAEALAAEDAEVTPDNEVYDGRWRFLVHDMDYTYNLYDRDKAMASFNNLSEIMDPHNDRYAALFVSLMNRPESRTYFRNKVTEYVEGPLSEEGITKTYMALHGIREKELGYFYSYLQELNHRGLSDIWTNASMYQGHEDSILAFAKKRASYALKYMNMLLPEI